MTKCFLWLRFQRTILVLIFLNIFCVMSFLINDTDLTSHAHEMVSLTMLLVTMNIPKQNFIDRNGSKKLRKFIKYKN